MSAIVIPDVLGRFIITTLTFEELASLDGKELDGYARMTRARAEIGIVREGYNRVRSQQSTFNLMGKARYADTLA
jgi:hypothetical protein